MDQLWQLSASELGRAYTEKRTDPLEVTRACLDRIGEVDPGIGAFTHVDADRALADARALASELRAGEARGPLHGIPVAIKELFDIAGVSTGYGSLVCADVTPDADALVVTRLREAGAIVLGATRSHEFAWGFTTQHALRGSTRNPWRRDRIPGGSSGGSGAAVAAGMVPIAIASDTGGSIRVPSAFCGVLGVKPTFGRVPLTGAMSLAVSFDTAGVLARDVADLRTVLHAIAGPDPSDPASMLANLPAPAADADPGDLAGLRIGFVPAPCGFPVMTERLDRYQRALERVADAGAELITLDLPDAAEIRAAFGPIQMAEAYDLHTRRLGLFPEHGARYGADVRSRLVAAAEVGIADYLAAQEARTRLSAAIVAAMRTVDAMISPISAVAPTSVDDPDVAHIDGADYPLRDAVMGFTLPQNLTGAPAVAIRAGFASDGLPIGLQVSTAPGREETALRIGALLDRLLGGQVTFPV